MLLYFYLFFLSFWTTSFCADKSRKHSDDRGFIVIGGDFALFVKFCRKEFTRFYPKLVEWKRIYYIKVYWFVSKSEKLDELFFFLGDSKITLLRYINLSVAFQKFSKTNRFLILLAQLGHRRNLQLTVNYENRYWKLHVTDIYCLRLMQ